MNNSFGTLLLIIRYEWTKERKWAFFGGGTICSPINDGLLHCLTHRLKSVPFDMTLNTVYLIHKYVW